MSKEYKNIINFIERKSISSTKKHHLFLSLQLVEMIHVHADQEESLKNVVSSSNHQ